MAGKIEMPLIYSVYNPNTDRSILTRDMTYNDVRVPMGFDTDFTTTKWYLRWFIPRFGKGNVGAVGHDWLYATNLYSRKKSDQYYRDTLIDAGVNKLNAYARWIGLRAAGWLWYNDAKSARLVREKFNITYNGDRNER